MAPHVLLERIVLGVAVAALVLGLVADRASAHAEPDVVAVPAGDVTQVTLKPTHGCGDSPTTEVATRVPVAGATPVDVPGWTAEASAEGDATVLEWRGGELPADQVGAFPIELTVPDRPGTLLTFPFVQTCADGTELAWIDGNPEGEYPAPRLLVLPVGSAAATSIGDVPADAPGRDQLVEVVDVDNPEATPTTTSAPTTTSPTSTTGSDTSAAADPDEAAVAGDGDDGSSALPIVLGIGGVLVVVALVAVALRRRSRSEPTPR